MESARRRERILDRLAAATSPVPAALLGSELGVSRQIVVSDVALLRASGQPVRATNRGYVLAPASARPRRTFHVQHGADLVETELNAVVDAGGTLLDVSISHAVYGKVTVPQVVRDHEDITRLLSQMRDVPLLPELTGGDHVHTVEADDEDTLDAVGAALDALGILAHDR